MQVAGKIGRRSVLAGLGSSLLLPSCSSPVSTSLDFENLSKEDAYKLYLKTIGSLETESVYIWFKGVLWGALPDQLPQAFCGFQGLARHDWKQLDENSYFQTEYDVGFFSDLETGAPVSQILNPFTKETVETFHYIYGGFKTKHSPDGFPETQVSKNLEWRTTGDRVTLTQRATGQMTSKFQPEDWPRESSGPVNYFGGETSYALSRAELSDPDNASPGYTLFWTSFAPWEPWLMMDDAAGVCQWRATGVKLDSYEQAPDTVLDFVRRVQPNYFDAGPPWDGIISNSDRYRDSRRN